ncbi:hypothetical protein CLAVI_000198 [Candidatus Clavichlamydia salmonicola]|uniref:hypothetical protein n=1 Tax=Candidatus Clavichlamydia salmonicola TaxID=469812 RepID=UPI0018912AB1|nr:hypothetical protein [Candidatus Clavichlamydia salmonicola]MBF5050587.1 hypothetical protein [Candidatus Clavichlamydia salmonicola]
MSSYLPSLLYKAKNTLLHPEKPAHLPSIAFYLSIVLLGIAALSFIIAGAVLGSISLASPGIVIALLLKIVLITKQYVVCKKSKTSFPKFIHSKQSRSKLISPQPSCTSSRSSSSLSLPKSSYLKRKDQDVSSFFKEHSLQIVNDLPYKLIFSTSQKNLSALQQLLFHSWGTYEKSSQSFTLLNLYNGVHLTLAKHNPSFVFKTFSIDNIKNAKIAMVHAFNNSITSNTKSSLTPLSSLVTSECWRQSMDNKSKLTRNEVTSGLWAPLGPTSKGTPVPYALIQATAPSAENKKVNITEELKSLKKIFLNILQEAQKFNCSHIQLPLLRGDLHFDSDQEKSEWLYGSYRMLLEAIDILPSSQENLLQHVVLVDESEIFSLATIANNYCRSIAHVLEDNVHETISLQTPLFSF